MFEEVYSWGDQFPLTLLALRRGYGLRGALTSWQTFDSNGASCDGIRRFEGTRLGFVNHIFRQQPREFK
jgi:hypothetical protein